MPSSSPGSAGCPRSPPDRTSAFRRPSGNAWPARPTALSARLVETRRDIHRHPELGFRETRTAKLIADRLRALGFDEVREQVGVTGVVGVLKGGRPGKVVAVRSDMDALPIPELIDVPYKSTVPDVKHACGHDGHMAIALGVAEIFSGMRADIPGTVVFLFQPAEEGDPDGGIVGCAADARRRRLRDACAGSDLRPARDADAADRHARRQRRARRWPAATASRLTITGKKTHAAYPHTGIDPIPIAAQVINALQTIPSRMNNAAEPIVVSVGTINGGNRYNIIADAVTLTGTVRTLAKDGPERVKALMERAIKGVTEASGATYTFDFHSGNPVTYNEETLATASLPVLADVVGGPHEDPRAAAADGRGGFRDVPAADSRAVLLSRRRQHGQEDHGHDPHRVLRSRRGRAADRRPCARRRHAGFLYRK